VNHEKSSKKPAFAHDFRRRLLTLQQKLVIDEEVTNAWGRLTSDSSETSWIAAGYPEGNSLQISVRFSLLLLFSILAFHAVDSDNGMT
jgi:hypothetical protein